MHDAWSDAIERRLQMHRQRAQELLDEQLARVRAIECSLGDQAPAATETVDGYRQRYEMALADIRTLKQNNAELQKELNSRQSLPNSDPDTPDDAPVAMDWEAQKRRLLAQLEADSEDHGVSASERLTMQSLVEQTNEAIAAKDQEIARLTQLLKEQEEKSEQVGNAALTPGQLVETDELLQQERESLQRIQDEWREKLRKAEVEISLERAKIGREKAKLEETMRNFERERAHLEAALAEAEASGKPIKKSGRWLAQLGISRDDE